MGRLLILYWESGLLHWGGVCGGGVRVGMRVRFHSSFEASGFEPFFVCLCRGVEQRGASVWLAVRHLSSVTVCLSNARPPSLAPPNDACRAFRNEVTLAGRLWRSAA